MGDSTNPIMDAIEPMQSTKAMRARILQLEQVVEQQREEMEKRAGTKFVLPTGKPRGGRRKSAYCRVIVPDTHGAYIEPDACKAFLADLKSIDPAEIVLLGDHLDCSGFLAEHQTLAYVAEGDYGFADDVAATNQFLDAIQSRSPSSTKVYIEGNHERRIERWIITQMRRNHKDAEYLHSFFSVETVLGLEKRGLRWIRQGKFYDGLPIPAAIKLGRCHYTHGEYIGQNAARTHLQKWGGNVVYGHTHRCDAYTRRTVNAGVIGAWCPGCLCQLQRLWNHTNLTDWSHGYGLQAVMPDGGFLHINVPIIDGVSYLAPLARSLAA